MNSNRGPSGPSKLINTSSLTVTLLLLFLPFIGVSCDSGVGTINAEISGWDMALGGSPSVSRTGIFSSTESDISVAPPGRVVDDGDVQVQPLMVLAVLAILSGILVGIILRTAQARALGAGIAAGLAALLIAINQIDVTSALVTQITTSMEGVADDPAELVGNRIGFWLTFAALVITTAFHVGYLTLRRRGGAPPTGPLPSGLMPPGPLPPNQAPRSGT